MEPGASRVTPLRSVARLTAASEQKKNSDSTTPLTQERMEPGASRVTPLRSVARLTAASEGRPLKKRHNAYAVRVPEGLGQDRIMSCSVRGQRLRVRVPPRFLPGTLMGVLPPVPKSIPVRFVVPSEIPSNRRVLVSLYGLNISAALPPYALAGLPIQIEIPVATVLECWKERKYFVYSRRHAEGFGWGRTIRALDLKLCWVRLANHHPNHTSKNVMTETVVEDDHKCSYVRKLTVLEGRDTRLQTGTVEFVRVTEAAVASQLVWKNREIVSYTHIISQGIWYKERFKWFRGVCQTLTSLSKESGHLQIRVRRSHLLSDSVNAVMSMDRDDLRRRWCLEILDVDDERPRMGGDYAMREWTRVVAQELFASESGLWVRSSNSDLARLDINPQSAGDLVLFRFFGRFLGRALLENQRLRCCMVERIYKHLLGWPITTSDIEYLDEQYRPVLKGKLNNVDHLSNFCLAFLNTEEHLLLQLTEILLGFHDVIPHQALTVFDPDELEAMISEIDIVTWQTHTQYCGQFETEKQEHPVVQWFWEIVSDEFDEDMRERLLEFWTGESGYPLQCLLEDSLINTHRKFRLHGMDSQWCAYPKSHPDFAIIDIPMYGSKEELCEKLKLSVTMVDWFD